MSEEIIVRHCSPTLAGLKTGNIFSHEFATRRELLSDMRRLNKKLVPKGLRAVPLKYENRSALIYLYRPDMLEEDLCNVTACRLLCKKGYKCKSFCEDIVMLQQRLKSSDSFPHEIGLFLGYPPKEVEGFIQNKRPCKMCGYWKVYYDKERAQREFEKYRKCTKVYLRKQSEGASIEDLTVKKPARS